MRHEQTEHPSQSALKGVHLKSIDVHEIPPHLVAFALWLYARPNLAIVSHTPKVTNGADVKSFLEHLPRSETGATFQWLDGRCVSFAITRGKFNVRDYDAANGKNTAIRAIEGMRRLLADKTAELGSKDKAIQAITEAKPTTLAPSVDRFFSIGPALFEELCLR